MRDSLLPAKLLLVILALFASEMGSAQERTPTPETARAWGFDRSDLQPHPGVRFGVLANGMRYALMRGAAGDAGLSVRLRFDAGATVEGAREQGFMHVIEHLIFGGSTNLPRGALLFMLPHQGLRRLSDFNAFTEHNQTVYRLDLPRADRRSRDTALMVMREIAGELSFDRRTVDIAKAMVRAEIDERDVATDRVVSARDAFFMPGTPVARGPVTGTDKDVRRAGSGVLRLLYARYYAPRRATLVVAGNFDPAAVDAEIATRFGGWRARGAFAGTNAPPAMINAGRPAQARLFVDPAAATVVTIAAVSPLGPPDAGARRDAVYLEHLAAEMLTRRLTFMGAKAAAYDYLSTARLATVELSAKDRDWARALQAAKRELQRVLSEGFSQEELETQLAASRRGLAGDAAPRTSRVMADGLIDAVERGIVYTAPGDASATREYLAGIKLADVDAAFRAAWARARRLIFVTHNRSVAGGEAAIMAVWTRDGPEPAN